MSNATNTQNALEIPLKCLDLLLLFWGTFTKFADYKLAPGVLEKARELTYQHIINNCENGHFDDPAELRLALHCVKKCARLCNDMVEDAQKDGTPKDEITVSDYTDAFVILQGGTGGTGTPPPAPVPRAMTADGATEEAAETDDSDGGSPPRGKFHGLLCSDR